MYSGSGISRQIAAPEFVITEKNLPVQKNSHTQTVLHGNGANGLINALSGIKYFPESAQGMNMKEKIAKTNAARMLDKSKISYRLVPYEVDENDLSAKHVAEGLGENIEQVFKTLVCTATKPAISSASCRATRRSI